jgi:hypothetical protein
MQANTETILQAALQLSEDERYALVSRIIETLPEPDCEAGLSLDDPDLLEELDRRFADESDTIPWSQLRRES